MRNLTAEESEAYMTIVKHGNMDDMFEFGYQCGAVDATKEALDVITTKKETQ